MHCQTYACGRWHPTQGCAACRNRLQSALDQWPAEGGMDARGAQVGGRVLLRADHITLLDDAFSDSPALGAAVCVAAFHAVIAVGTSSGAVLVLLPRGITSAGQLSGCGTLRVPNHWETAGAAWLESMSFSTLTMMQ